ncbi:MAG: hypothetical protein WC666_00335 [Candidatus Paceibacterota bacterium]|jgi:hypothetical protein
MNLNTYSKRILIVLIVAILVLPSFSEASFNYNPLSLLASIWNSVKCLVFTCPVEETPEAPTELLENSNIDNTVQTTKTLDNDYPTNNVDSPTSSVEQTTPAQQSTSNNQQLLANLQAKVQALQSQLNTVKSNLTANVSSSDLQAIYDRISRQADSSARSAGASVSSVSNNGAITSPSITGGDISGSAITSSSFSGTTGVFSSTLNVTGLTTLGYASTTQLTTTGSTYLATGGGNVGVGTTSPTSLLQVAGATAPKITLSDTDASTNQKHWFIESNSGQFYIGTTSDALATNASYRALAITSAGNVGIGTVNPLAILHVGSGVNNNSVDSQILISRSVNDSVSGNGHAFSDSSYVVRSGTISYNSFDGRIFVGGVADYGHYAAFQNGANYSSSGTMDTMYGFVNVPSVNYGTVTNMYGSYSADPTGSGTVVNNYGVYIPQLSKGTTKNYAIYTAGTTTSSFGGPIALGTGTKSGMLFIQGSTDDLPIITLKPLNSSDDIGLKMTGTSGVVFGGITGNNLTGEVRIGSFHSGYFPTFYANNSEVMRITSSKVGIGTTSPQAYLHIDTKNGGDQIVSQMWGYNTLDMAYNLKLKQSVTAGVVRWTFDQTNGTSYPDVLTFDRGNVGIGTTSPYTKLSVAGSSNQTTPIFAVSTSTASATTTVFQINSDGTLTINTPLATSTIIGNIRVIGGFRADNTYTGDLIFANNFRFTEALSDAVPQALFLQNQKGDSILNIDEEGNLNILGDICSNSVTCFNRSLNTLRANLDALASTTAEEQALTFSGLNTKIDDFITNVGSTTLSLNSRLLNLENWSLIVSTTTASTTDYINSQSFIEKIATAVLDLIKSIGNLAMNTITAVSGVFTRVKTDMLCVGETCLNEDQIKALLINASSTISLTSLTPTPTPSIASPISTPTPEATPVPTVTPTSTSTPSVATSTEFIATSTEPIVTPEPIVFPTPTATPTEPTITPEVTLTPTPELTPLLTPTPEPVLEPTPEITPTL